VTIGRAFAEIWRFFDFFLQNGGLRPSFHDLLRRVLGSLYRCANFVWTSCSSFDNIDNIEVSIFARFA